MDTYELAICTDCLLFIVNGDLPEDETRAADLPADIERNWPPPWNIAPACDDDCASWFSWRACECCGSRLGGDRHKAIAYKRAE